MSRVLAGQMSENDRTEPLLVAINTCRLLSLLDRLLDQLKLNVLIRHKRGHHIKGFLNNLLTNLRGL